MAKTRRNPGRRHEPRRGAASRLGKLGLGAVAAALLGYGLYFALGDGLGGTPEVAYAAEAVAYYDPNCGCCALHAAYLERSGFTVEVQEQPDMAPIKRSYGIPQELLSCHTTVVDGYVVEGHMPLQAIEKLLEERPDIRGIALAGMPSGSPGMPGAKTQTWTIYTLEHDGTIKVFLEV